RDGRIEDPGMAAQQGPLAPFLEADGFHAPIVSRAPGAPSGWPDNTRSEGVTGDGTEASRARAGGGLMAAGRRVGRPRRLGPHGAGPRYHPPAGRLAGLGRRLDRPAGPHPGGGGGGAPRPALGTDG